MKDMRVERAREVLDAIPWGDPNISKLTMRQNALEALAILSKPSAEHPDNSAVDRFARAMKDKLAQKRAEGRGGWEDPDQCSIEFLQYLLSNHVEKGDPVDVGNLVMMIWNRGGSTTTAEPNTE